MDSATIFRWHQHLRKLLTTSGGVLFTCVRPASARWFMFCAASSAPSFVFGRVNISVGCQPEFHSLAPTCASLPLTMPLSMDLKCIGYPYHKSVAACGASAQRHLFFWGLSTLPLAIHLPPLPACDCRSRPAHHRLAWYLRQPPLTCAIFSM